MAFRCERCREVTNEFFITDDLEVKFLCSQCLKMWLAVLEKIVALSQGATDELIKAFFGGKDISL